jgi:hypothetical protein
MLEKGNIPWRLYLAITHRLAQKEVLKSQSILLKILLSIMNRLKTKATDGSEPAVVSLKEAYIAPVEKFEKT